MAYGKQSPKPVFVRVRVEVGESEYFSYKSKKGEAEMDMCVTEDQLQGQNVQRTAETDPLEKIIQPDCDMPGDGYP